jgi:hypothetical protein
MTDAGPDLSFIWPDGCPCSEESAVLIVDPIVPTRSSQPIRSAALIR